MGGSREGSEMFLEEVTEARSLRTKGDDRRDQRSYIQIKCRFSFLSAFSNHM